VGRFSRVGEVGFLGSGVDEEMLNERATAIPERFDYLAARSVATRFFISISIREDREDAESVDR